MRGIYFQNSGIFIKKLLFFVIKIDIQIAP